MPKSKYVPLSGNLNLHNGIPAHFRMVQPDHYASSAYQRRYVRHVVFQMNVRGGKNSSSGSGNNTKRGTFSKIWDNLKHPLHYFKRLTAEVSRAETATVTTTCSVKKSSPEIYSGATYHSIRKGKMKEVGRVEKVQSWITEMPDPTMKVKSIIDFP